MWLYTSVGMGYLVWCRVCIMSSELGGNHLFSFTGNYFDVIFM